MLTMNEKMVLRLLMSTKDTYNSINEIARLCDLAPNGALKILKKFEKEGVLIVKKIANIKAYRINFNDEKTENILELALMSNIEGRIKYRLEDLKQMGEITSACVLFGSFVTRKEPKDLDALFIVEKKNYKKYRASMKNTVTPVKIHDIVQTEEDLKNNLMKNDDVILQIIRQGIVLWGYKIIVRAVSDVYKT